MSERIEIITDYTSSPYWIRIIWPFSGNAKPLSLWEAKELRLKLDVAILSVERQEEIDHARRLKFERERP